MGHGARPPALESPTAAQRRTWEALAAGRSVILRAPTGSGKTEATTFPFLRGDLRAERLTYVLPMRTLADQLGGRLRAYGRAWGIQITVHHGEEATVRDFPPPALVTTLDQAVTAYAATPLSSPLRWGHVLGGHIATSFLVFDEVHLYDPDLGLQAALLMAEGARATGLPVAVSTATLPIRIVEELKDFLDAEVVEGGELFPRSVELRRRTDRLGPERVLEAAKEVAEGTKGALVFCNTVARAQELYRAVAGQVPEGVELHLVHSRYVPQDRRRKEQGLVAAFGKDGHRRAVAITTSVAEVGLDISAELALTEVCPADALVQRAGRLARWGGAGRMDVFGSDDPGVFGPYDEKRCRATAEALPRTLSWEAAQALVDQVYDDLRLSNPASLARVAALIDEGSFAARRRRVHEAVRELDRVEVSVWEGAPLRPLPRVPIGLGALRRGLSGTVSRAQPDGQVFEKVEIRKVRAGDWVVLAPTQAGYDPDLGLTFAPGCPMAAQTGGPEIEAPPEGPHTYGDVLWVEHCRAILEAAQEHEEEVDATLAALGPLLDGIERPRETLLAALALHDLGKLAEDWQRAIGSPGQPLSHFERPADGRRPPHATVSAAALEGPLEALGALGRVLLYAAAHHHRARASECPPYRLGKGWEEQVRAGLRGIHPETVDRLVRGVKPEGGPRVLSRILPVTRRPQLWVGYLAASRLLVLLDRRAVELRRSR